MRPPQGSPKSRGTLRAARTGEGAQQRIRPSEPRCSGTHPERTCAPEFLGNRKDGHVGGGGDTGLVQQWEEGGDSGLVGSDLTCQELLVEKVLKLGGIQVQFLIQTREEDEPPQCPGAERHTALR